MHLGKFNILLLLNFLNSDAFFPEVHVHHLVICKPE